VHDLEDIMHAIGLKVAVLEGRAALADARAEELKDTAASLTTRGETLALADRLKELKEQAVTRAEFSPVQKIVYGLAATIMGAFIMAVAMLVFKAFPK
jgi:predicted NBD/HSP70 family sugar kinase